MFVILIFLLIACAAYASCTIRDTATGVVALVATLLLFTSVIGVHYNSIGVTKVETLKSIGMQPLSTEQVYNMSKKDLDKCTTIHTFDKTYYFNTEEIKK